MRTQNLTICGRTPNHLAHDLTLPCPNTIKTMFEKERKIKKEIKPKNNIKKEGNGLRRKKYRKNSEKFVVQMQYPFFSRSCESLNPNDMPPFLFLYLFFTLSVSISSSFFFSLLSILMTLKKKSIMALHPRRS